MWITCTVTMENLEKYISFLLIMHIRGNDMDNDTKALKQRIDELESNNYELKAENEELKERILDLEACV